MECICLTRHKIRASSPSGTSPEQVGTFDAGWVRPENILMKADERVPVRKGDHGPRGWRDPSVRVPALTKDASNAKTASYAAADIAVATSSGEAPHPPHDAQQAGC